MYTNRHNQCRIALNWIYNNSENYCGEPNAASCTVGKCGIKISNETLCGIKTYKEQAKFLQTVDPTFVKICTIIFLKAKKRYGSCTWITAIQFSKILKEQI